MPRDESSARLPSLARSCCVVQPSQPCASGAFAPPRSTVRRSPAGDDIWCRSRLHRLTTRMGLSTRPGREIPDLDAPCQHNTRGARRLTARSPRSRDDHAQFLNGSGAVASSALRLDELTITPGVTAFEAGKRQHAEADTCGGHRARECLEIVKHAPWRASCTVDRMLHTRRNTTATVGIVLIGAL